MPSALSKQRDYKYIAQKYSELNRIQVEAGKNLIKRMGVKRGDKVMDMGCGTGEITSFIADLVGEEGQVLGIDPDQERIKVAVQKHCGTKNNLKFMVGESSSHFPHYNEEHYDVHFSNFVFQWLTTREKNEFLKTAFNCLKRGGKMAIGGMDECPEVVSKVLELLPDNEIENNRPPDHYVLKSVAGSMMVKSGFGEILLNEYAIEEIVFSSMETFLTWICVSDYIDESKIEHHKKEMFAETFVNKDGTISFEAKYYRIIANK